MVSLKAGILITFAGMLEVSIAADLTSCFGTSVFSSSTISFCGATSSTDVAPSVKIAL